MTRLIRIFAVLLIIATVAACSAGPPPSRSSQSGSKSASSEFDNALALMKSGDSESAIQAFLALSERYPRATGPLTNLGILAARQQQHEFAAKYFLAALQRDAKNVTALNWMGFVTSKGGNFNGALDWYNKALAVRGDYAPAHLNLGILYETVFKRGRQALEHYRRYQELTGGDNMLVSAWIHNLESASDYVAANVSQVNR
ncbi:tetratricopeptide repeat protein [Zhongshania sp.]|uniref:tetratricopeptide repeat protein n=1 Tax=Zhongshania sp. TaxID=1971902 RepID=UPI00356A2813